MSIGRSATSLVLLSALLTPSVARAQATQWQVGAAPSVSSGRYGSSSRTEVIYSPLTARRLFDAGDLTLVVPWMCVRGGGSVVVVSGSPVVSAAASRPAADAPTRPVADAPARTRPGALTRDGEAAATPPAESPPVRAPTATTVCGLGDLVVRGRYYLPDGGQWGPALAVRTHVKVPTASAAQGLGTGRADTGIGLEITQPLPFGTAILFDGGVTVIGKPERSALQNTWWYDLGLSQDVAGGLLNVSLFFEEYRAVVPGTEDGRDLFAALSLRANGGWRLQASGLRGLSDGAPDYAFGLGLSVRF